MVFDLERAWGESGLSPDDLACLEARIREEFSEDALMFELHFLRAVKAFQEGWVTREELLAESVTDLRVVKVRRSPL
jgi:hypothetical protein